MQPRLCSAALHSRGHAAHWVSIRTSAGDSLPLKRCPSVTASLTARFLSRLSLSGGKGQAYSTAPRVRPMHELMSAEAGVDPTRSQDGGS